MSELPATSPVEPRKLGFIGKAIVATAVVLTAVFGVVAAVAIRGKRIENGRRETTNREFSAICLWMRVLGTPRSDESHSMFSRISVYLGPPANTSERYAWAHPLASKVVCDGWGHPIYYRCPGPVHKNGWDLISCGPNGVYEEGGGDDIVVGEDLPGGLAAISSESGTATESK